MENIKYFKDLPEEKQLEQLKLLDQGEPIYGLSEHDDTHIKFAVMMVINHMKEIKKGTINTTSLLEIGIDSKGLFVSFPLNNSIS